jgi:uncharacterized membrane protein YeaQ/YmgE (transglycosylase-associated protein family)
MNMIFADLVLPPASIAVWIVVGLIIGWLAAKVMENPSYGLMGDLLLGSIGAVAGGALVGFFVEGAPGFWIAVLTALAGAFVVVVGGRLVVARLSA